MNSVKYQLQVDMTHHHNPVKQDCSQIIYQPFSWHQYCEIHNDEITYYLLITTYYLLLHNYHQHDTEKKPQLLMDIFCYLDTPPEETADCTTGCIVGIVIACLVILGGACGGGFYIFKRK